MVVDMIFDGCEGLCSLSRQIRETRFGHGKLSNLRAARGKPQLRERFGRIQELYTCPHGNYNTSNGSILVSCVGSLFLC